MNMKWTAPLKQSPFTEVETVIHQTPNPMDIVVEYDGEEREDDCFNIFNNSPLLIDSIKVDINPISNYKTGSIDFFLEKSRLYDVELIKNLNNNL